MWQVMLQMLQEGAQKYAGAATAMIQLDHQVVSTALDRWPFALGVVQPP